MSGLDRLQKATREMRERRVERDLAMCLKKKKYRTLKFAEEIADKVFAERKIGLRAYLCPVCQGYHLTHKQERKPL